MIEVASRRSRVAHRFRINDPKHVSTQCFFSGMEISRPYTPVPPCLHPDDMAPSYKSDCMCLMIKKYPSGALSPSITALQTSQTLVLSNALGAFVVESFDRYSVIHMLAGGTGLTAMLGIIQRALARRTVLVFLSWFFFSFSTPLRGPICSPCILSNLNRLVDLWHALGVSQDCGKSLALRNILDASSFYRWYGNKHGSECNCEFSIF